MSKERIGSIKDHTPNFKIIIPRFDLATWHDYIEENFRNIDALFFNLFGINNYSGSWKQITEYKQGQVLFIGDDLDINGNVTEFSGRLVKVLEDHVTDNSDYFNVFYSLHPEYYELFADASTAQIYAQQAQNYKNETETLKNNTNIIKEETNSIKNEADLIKSEVITKQNEINDTISAFNEDFSVKTEQIDQKFEDSKTIIDQKIAISEENVEKSRIWAEGEQAEVELLGGELSSKEWSLQSKNSSISANQSAIQAKTSETNAKSYAESLNYDNLLNKNMITNCITEIPQDIKLELNNGTLTLKAGSKVYVPNGFEADGTTPKFDVVVIESDLVRTNASGSYIRNVYVNAKGTSTDVMTNSFSGNTAPDLTNMGAAAMWYDTANNLMKKTTDYGATWTSAGSLPIAIITSTDGVISSIDQVFNGFGYIGSTIFALPGVKGLGTKGRNADGSLNNEERVWTSVQVLSTASVANTFLVHIKSNASVRFAGRDTHFEQNEKPTITTTYATWYSPVENILRFTNDKGATWIDSIGFIHCVTITTTTGGVITSFQPKLPFHAVDYNDSSWVAGQAMPSGKYINLTLGASGSKYKAPANGWFTLQKVTGSANLEGINLYNQTSSNMGVTCYFYGTKGYNCNATVQAKKGDIIYISYNASGDVKQFRFIYAEGDK